ncbi:hypothetical protein ES703_43021 [subsurface metagenome]
MLGLKQKIVSWLLRGVHIDELHVGEHSVVIASSGINMGATPITNPDTVRTATVVVAANDSSAESKLQADYVCDGTDDHVEIQAALAALPGGAGEVLLLEGTYYIEVRLALDSNQTLRGCGKNTILTTTTIDLDIITATGGDGTELTGILIADFCIDGDAGEVANVSGILWAYVDYSKIRDIWSQDNGTGSGIRLNNCDFNEIIGCTCQGNTSNGIYLSTSNNNTVSGNTCQGNLNGICVATSSENNTVSGNTCQGNTGNGIYLAASSNNNTVSGNTCQGSVNGIQVATTAHNNTVSGNTCQGNNNGIYLYDSCCNNTIAGNTCQGNGNHGIIIELGSNNNTSTGNTCQGNGGAGICLYDSNCNNTISGNTCQGSGNTGIYIELGSNNNTITGNTCQGSLTGAGIFLYESSHNTVTGNTCQGNGGAGFFDGRGIYLYGSCHNNTVSGNTSQGNAKDGICVDGSDNNNIVGNVCLENSQETDNAFDNIFLTNSDYNLIIGNVCRRGTQDNKPRYGINISNDNCDRNCLIGNDLYDSGSTGDLNDVPTTNPTLKHDNRNLAGTGWLAEV